MNLENWSEKMSNAADISDELHSAMTRIAGPREWVDTREAWIARAARRAGISFRMARSLFYREVKDPKWSGVDAVLNAARRLDEEQELRARDEHQEMAARIEALEARIAELAGAPAHSSGGEDRPVVKREGGMND